MFLGEVLDGLLSAPLLPTPLLGRRSVRQGSHDPVTAVPPTFSRQRSRSRYGCAGVLGAMFLGKVLDGRLSARGTETGEWYGRRGGQRTERRTGLSERGR
eukprot:CAMPEP_0196668366 /NCGR_PEP_ID=MMETSP1086-20130531/65584_1 /TAXON_ID=77921 /ORGANISM="Cyanoptyche  gloeocystis , Strain SAG4.97" /LENGTH=99 /DNA_ID=CAMNT_0042005771 /DNA_START=947 /DNA_END=1243 /DNA_ORIENTATION=+